MELPRPRRRADPRDQDPLRHRLADQLRAQQLLGVAAVQPLELGRAAPIVPMVFVTPAVTSCSTANGFSADGARRLRDRWPSSTSATGGIAPAARCSRPDPPEARRRAARRSSRSAAAPGTISRCSANSARSMRSSSTTRRASCREAPRQAGDERAATRTEGRSRAHYDLIGAFDVIEHIDDDRAALASIAPSV